MNTLTNIRNMHDNKNDTRKGAPYSAKCLKKEFHKIDVLMGARVKRLRINRGISQTDLGSSLGITFQQIQKYEKGANRISTSRLFQMAQAFGITTSELVSGLEDSVGTQITQPSKAATTLELRAAKDFAKLGRDQQLSVHNIIKVLVSLKG